MATSEPAEVPVAQEFELRWIGVHEAPTEFVDQLACSLGTPASPSRTPDSVVLTLGRVQQPFVTGSPAQRARQLADIESVEIKTLARFVMSRDRLQELRDLVDTTIRQFDAVETDKS